MKLKTLIQKAIELEEDYGDYEVEVQIRGEEPPDLHLEVEDLAVYPQQRKVRIETP